GVSREICVGILGSPGRGERTFRHPSRLSPLRGSVCFRIFPTAHAVGYLLSPLRGSICRGFGDACKCHRINRSRTQSHPVAPSCKWVFGLRSPCRADASRRSPTKAEAVAKERHTKSQ